MTRAEIAKLSPEEKRTMIAEACGWKWIKQDCHFGGEYWFGSPERMTKFIPDLLLDHMPQTGRFGGIFGGESALPDYLSDLNAMRAAIMSKPPEFRKAMRFWIYELTDQMSAHFADAATMADAFLLTLK